MMMLIMSLLSLTLFGGGDSLFFYHRFEFQSYVTQQVAYCWQAPGASTRVRQKLLRWVSQMKKSDKRFQQDSVEKWCHNYFSVDPLASNPSVNPLGLEFCSQPIRSLEYGLNSVNVVNPQFPCGALQMNSSRIWRWLSLFLFLFLRDN